MPIFEPPIVYDNPPVLPETRGIEYELFKYYGPYPRGRSVLKIAGVYTTVDYPDQDTLALATEVYLGGHAYVVSEAVSTALIAAGYTTSAEPAVTEHTWGAQASKTWGEAAGYTWGTL